MPTRRTMIRLLGGVAATSLLPVNLTGCGSGPGTSRGSTYVPTPDEPLTPTDQFYINSNYATPAIPARWQLHVQGLVDREVAFTLDQLRAMPSVTREITLECIGNSPGGTLISSAAFTGVLLREVVDRAGRSDRARGLQFLGLDGFPAYMPVELAEGDDALLAYEMNGEPLSLDHGGPVRSLLPGRYGMFSTKWLDSVTLTREYATYGSLSELVNFVDGRVRVRSKIDPPLYDGARVLVGQTVEIRGIAVTPGTGVARVQVDTGSGWEEAELTFNLLDDDRDSFLWSLWSLSWTPDSAGVHVVQVRAFDPAGDTQDAEADFPYDSSAIHRIRVRVEG